MFGRIGPPEIVIILIICVLIFIPIAVAIWLGVTVVGGARAKQRELEARIEALERAQRKS